MDRHYMTEEFASHMRASIAAGGNRKYRPSNGTEGAFFEASFCEHCKRDAEYRRTDRNGCDILCAMLCFGVDESEYPKEIIYGDDGHPTCTAFDEITP